MYRELLLCMLGLPGDIFTAVCEEPASAEKNESDVEVDEAFQTFHVNPAFPVVHTAERTLLNRLAHLGSLFQRLTRLTAGGVGRDGSTKSQQGQFHAALCSAVERFVLLPYRVRILEVERALLVDHGDLIHYDPETIEPPLQPVPETWTFSSWAEALYAEQDMHTGSSEYSVAQDRPRPLSIAELLEAFHEVGADCAWVGLSHSSAFDTPACGH